MEDSSQPVEKPVKPKLRWYQYSLRSLLIFVTLFAFACSWLAVKKRQAKRQKEAVEIIQMVGGNVWYDYQETAPRTVSTAGKPREPDWLLKILTEDFFHKPVNITFFGTPKDEGWSKAVNDLPSLKTLLLSGRNISDKTLENLAMLPNLEELHANSSSVSDEGLKNLEKFPKLRWLTIHYTKVTDSGLIHVKSLKHLEWLILTGDNISDAAIPDLSLMTTLQLLDVRETAITARGYAKLKKALPNCNVMWQAK